MSIGVAERPLIQQKSGKTNTGLSPLEVLRAQLAAQEAEDAKKPKLKSLEAQVNTPEAYLDAINQLTTLAHQITADIQTNPELVQSLESQEVWERRVVYMDMFWQYVHASGMKFPRVPSTKELGTENEVTSGLKVLSRTIDMAADSVDNPDGNCGTIEPVSIEVFAILSALWCGSQLYTAANFSSAQYVQYSNTYRGRRFRMTQDDLGGHGGKARPHAHIEISNTTLEQFGNLHVYLKEIPLTPTITI
jgi:hypothetical protein